MNTDNIAIKVENVSKTFYIPTERKETLKSYFLNPFHRAEKRRFEALKDISFEVKKGEFIGIIGRNGSGKSTLLKILAGIYLPDKGKVTVNGKIVPFLELGVGFNPELSGRENIFLNGTILGMSKKYLEKKFDEIIDFAEVREFIDMPLKYYSSGMQVRLAFAISIMSNGDIYLMDEVLAVGDTNFQGRCFEIFNRYKREGKTILLVTHDTSTVERYCDRAILLRKGVKQKDDKSSKVIKEYIYESMSDEEKRLADIQAKKDKKEIQEDIKKIPETKKIKITKVEFLNTNNEKQNVFKTGDTIIIKVHFKRFTKKITGFNVGLAIFNQENNYIFGTNSFMEKTNLKKYYDNSYFIIKFPNIPLKKNTYYIKSGIWGHHGSITYDFLDRSDTFKFYSNDLLEGIVDLKHIWL